MGQSPTSVGESEFLCNRTYDGPEPSLKTQVCPLRSSRKKTEHCNCVGLTLKIWGAFSALSRRKQLMHLINIILNLVSFQKTTFNRFRFFLFLGHPPGKKFKDLKLERVIPLTHYNTNFLLKNLVVLSKI